MSRVLVLGANGQLGADLVRVLTLQNIDFVALTRNEFDATTTNISLLKQYQVDYIINCIATTNVDAMEDASELAFSINTSFANKLARFCNQEKIVLFHMSTDYVFDGTVQTKYTENDGPNPLNIYGLSKYAGEIAVRNYHDKYFIFRVASLFGISGASGKGGNFINTMLRLGQEKDEVKVIANQITCPTSTLDVARCITHFIQNKISYYGIYNCVSSNSCNWFEFSQAIFKCANLDLSKLKEADFYTYPFKAKRLQYGVLDITKLSSYYAMPRWQDALQEYMNLLNKTP